MFIKVGKTLNILFSFIYIRPKCLVRLEFQLGMCRDSKLEFNDSVPTTEIRIELKCGSDMKGEQNKSNSFFKK